MALLTFVKNGIADAGQAAHRIGDAAQDVGAVAKGVSRGEMSMSEGLDLYGEAAELRDNTKVFQEEYEGLTQKLNEGLGDGSVGEKGMQDTIVEATNVIQDQQGVEEGNQGETYIYDGSGTAYKGFRDKETDDIGINVGEGGTNLNDGSETYSVMVHEVSHQNGADETKAHFLTDVAADSWNTENQFNGNETNTSKVNQGEWLNNQTTDSDGNRTADSLINQNTIKASQVDEFDPLLREELRDAKTYDEFVVELGKLDVDRSAIDKFKFVKVADGWTDIPDFVKDENKGWYTERVKNKGNHLQNLRLDDGLHLTMDIGQEGVWLHKDVYDPNKSLIHMAMHGAVEVAPDVVTNQYLKQDIQVDEIERE